MQILAAKSRLTEIALNEIICNEPIVVIEGNFYTTTHKLPRRYQQQMSTISNDIREKSEHTHTHISEERDERDKNSLNDTFEARLFDFINTKYNKDNNGCKRVL